ncbi:hypothetical protein V8E36_008903 [Tilletia maclaganii]
MKFSSSLFALAVVGLPTFASATSTSNNFYGIALSPYQSKQANATCRTTSQINRAVAKISTAGFKVIELEYLGHECSPPSVASVYKAAKKHGLKVAPTLHLNYAVKSNESDYETQANVLLDTIGAYPGLTDRILFGGEAITRRIDTAQNITAAVSDLKTQLAAKNYTGQTGVNEFVGAHLAVALCDLDFIGLSLDPWVYYAPPAVRDVGTWAASRVSAMKTLCPSTPVAVTRFSWTSNATKWGPIHPSERSQAKAFKTLNDAIGSGVLDGTDVFAWEYDDQAWKVAASFLAAAKMGPFTERFTGIFGDGFSFRGKQL